MAFLDRKEQVFDIQLTQHGKRMLGKGKFSPTYYAFYDDDIIYDRNFAGLDEAQNNAEPRILEAVRPETQYVFSGIETKINEMNKKVVAGQDKEQAPDIQNELDKEMSFSPLGTADLHSEYMPAWNIYMLEGQISGNVDRTYKSGSLNLRIPQINVDLNYTTRIYKDESLIVNAGAELAQNATIESLGAVDELAMLDDDAASGRPAYVFPDGTYHELEVSNGRLFTKVLENNTEFKIDNFDIEVFIVKEDDELERLEFLKPPESNIKNGILIENNTPVMQYQDFGPQFVEYYFDLLTDQEIDNEVYCKSLQKQTLEDIYSDAALFNCKDIPSDERMSDIYRISKEIDKDVC